MTAPLKKDNPSLITNLMKTVKENKDLKNSIIQCLNIHEQDSNGFYALYWAISHHNLTNVKVLLAHGCTLKVTESENALFYAIACDNLEALKFFIEKGIDKTITKTGLTDKKYTLMQYAQKLNRKAIIAYLN